ncbi:histidine-containing phosphotransfer protein 1-like [Punica granatum]|uniref:Histidine-containing phosphotransfer protein n=1 Tax=Punica granatum TaxID=22663 RepID=A0A6P8DM16_PUNGR|nr:histidine-containing phosphotransfer protein 1-like [Punica granatum]
MEVGELQQSLMDYMNSLRSQEILDSQFGQLQRLQDESSPNFVAEVLTLFFTDSKDLIKELSEALNQQNVDFKEVDSCVHQLKGSSASIGAQRLKKTCIDFSRFCNEKNRQACLKCLEQMREEFNLVRSKLNGLLQIEKQIVAAGGSIPIMDL